MPVEMKLDSDDGGGKCNVEEGILEIQEDVPGAVGNAGTGICDVENDVGLLRDGDEYGTGNNCSLQLRDLPQLTYFSQPLPPGIFMSSTERGVEKSGKRDYM